MDGSVHLFSYSSSPLSILLVPLPSTIVFKVVGTLYAVERWGVTRSIEREQAE